MRVGILGLGSIGMRHGENLRALGHDVLGYDIEAHRMSAFNEGCAHPSVERVLRWADAMVIASPTSEHFIHLNWCLDDLKPVLVEKPIALTAFECEKLAARIARHRVWVGYNLRFHHAVTCAREWLTAGAIGDLRFATFVCAQRNTKYVDPLVLNWSHEIDLAMHLLGKITSISCKADKLATTIAAMHVSGVPSAIHLNYETSPQARFFDIVGAAGAIRVDLAHCSTHIYDKQGEHPNFFLSKAWDQCYVEEMKAFVAAVEGKTTQLCTGAQGLDVLRVCLGVP